MAERKAQQAKAQSHDFIAVAHLPHAAPDDDENVTLLRNKRAFSAQTPGSADLLSYEGDAESAITDLVDTRDATPFDTMLLQRSASAENTLVRESRRSGPSKHAAKRRRLRSELIHRRRHSLLFPRPNSTLGSVKRLNAHHTPRRMFTAPTGAPSESSSSEDEDEEEEGSKFGFFFDLDGRKKMLLLALSISDMCAYVCLSMMAPFFPIEAEQKGLSNTLSGWIFGVFALVEVVFCPIFAHFMPRLGVRYTYIAGLFSSAGCNVLFGFLDETPSDTDGGLLFAVLCFVVRSCQALGMAAYLTAAFTIMSIEFRKNVTKAFAFNETFVAVGFMIGPTIGGALYSIGGFKLPFISLGIFLLILSVVNYFLLPVSSDQEDLTSESFSTYKFLTLPIISVVALSVAASGVGMSVLDPTLEPHLRGFGFDATVVGLLFLIPSGVYTFATPLVGWLSSKFSAYWMVVCGFLGLTLSLLLLAASPVLGFPVGFNVLYLNIVSLVALGITFAFAMIPTFEMMLNACILGGFRNSVALYSAVGGLWSSAYALGDFLGPVLGGALLDSVGFQWGITIVAALPLLQLLVLITVGISTRCRIARLEDDVLAIEAAESAMENSGHLPPVSERTPLIGANGSSKDSRFAGA